VPCPIRWYGWCVVRCAAIALALGCTTATGGPAHAIRQAKAPQQGAQRRAHRMPSSTTAHITSPSDARTTPAGRYGQLSQAECEAELVSRKIDFVRETGNAVLAPVRLTGPLHGVVFRTDAKDKDRPTSPYEIADCRLVLALDDFTEILRSHDIVE